jgi:phage terminase large subunit GpA-like protein
VRDLGAEVVLHGDSYADAQARWASMPEATRPDAPDRMCHFSDQLGDEFFRGLISEVFNPSKNRFEKRRGSVRNEPLDTWVHAYAAAHHPELRLHRATATDWNARAAQLLRNAPPSAPAAAAPAEQVAAPPAPQPVARPAPQQPTKPGGLASPEWSSRL